MNPTDPRVVVKVIPTPGSHDGDPSVCTRVGFRLALERLRTDLLEGDLAVGSYRLVEAMVIVFALVVLSPVWIPLFSLTALVRYVLRKKEAEAMPLSLPTRRPRFDVEITILKRVEGTTVDYSVVGRGLPGGPNLLTGGLTPGPTLDAALDAALDRIKARIIQRMERAS